MDFFLVVTAPFARFKRGDIIENMVKIQEVLAGEFRACVVRVGTPLTQGR
jgi:hypothetical protein